MIPRNRGLCEDLTRDEKMTSAGQHDNYIEDDASLFSTISLYPFIYGISRSYTEGLSYTYSLNKRKDRI
jgi:hypothetical protein